jgi:sugar phosphate isomerase/epimerase
MNERIRIGNQTAISCADPLEPFAFAQSHDLDAFEWFADKKTSADGTTAGWDEDDMDAAARASIREAGRTHDIQFTVHAPWQANPLHTGGEDLLYRSLMFARDIGAHLVNLHLSIEDGVAGFVRALLPLAIAAGRSDMTLTLENTPQTTPQDFNEAFALLAAAEAVPPGTIGMCLDIGHANLCAATHNDFLRFYDQLAPEVPLAHLHMHENYGDVDRHLPLFTGPAGKDDSAIRAFLQRLRARAYRGVMILEQWPDPPELLVTAATRLRQLLASEGSPAGTGGTP